GDHMLYAASLPKICIMLAVYQKAAEGRLQIDDETYAQMVRMIRRSTNDDSTALMHKVDKDYIARVMLSPRYRLYDPYHNGGLWAGKDYAAVGAWRRDPMYNISHGATAMQVARFYYLLQTGRLVSPQASREMKEILRYSQSDHKFLRGIREIRPDAIVYRKAGTWGNAHADGALIERRDGATYIAVGLAEDPMGGEWLKQIIIQMDRLIDAQPYYQRVRRTRIPGETPHSVSAGAERRARGRPGSRCRAAVGVTARAGAAYSPPSTSSRSSGSTSGGFAGTGAFAVAGEGVTSGTSIGLGRTPWCFWIARWMPSASSRCASVESLRSTLESTTAM